MAHQLDACRVYGVDGELLADGFVREQSAGELLVEAEHFSGHGLDEGDEVVVQVLSAVQGECTYDAHVHWSGARRIAVTDLRLRERVQKRAAVRVAVELPCRVTEGVTDGERVPLEQPLDVVLLDVSAYGVRFRSRTEVAAGTVLVVPFTAGRAPLDLVVEVVRHQELRSDVAHGCRLLDATERQTDELFRFVLEEQRRQLAERGGR